jgi:hypothetical protein
MAPLRSFALSLSLAAVLAPAAACTRSGEGTGASTTSTTGAGSSSSSAGTGGSAGTAGSAGTGGHGGAAVAMFCAPNTVATTPVGTSAFTVESAHYQLYAEATQDEAVEMGRLLEAAYGAFGAWFQATPPLGAGEHLQVKYYADQTNWAAGLAADGITAPTEAGGYYAPSTKTAYLFEQGNPYYSHVLLVHEATHQYHFLSRTKGQSLPFWYAEGHAEYLSRHDWDDHCVRIGVIPMLSWEDMSAQALAESQPPGIDVAAVVAGTAPPDRPAAWAIFRYLDVGDGGAHHDAFKLFRDAFDANVIDTAHSFTTLVGDPAALSAPIDAWIPTAQEPMKPIFTEWVHVGPGTVNADSPMYFSLAIVKDPVTHFEAQWDVPTATSWSAGAVLAYQDSDNYEAVVASADGTLRTFTSTAGSALWNDAGTAPLPKGGVGTIAVDFGGGGMVTVTVNGGASTLSIGSLPAIAGLAVNASQVGWHDVGWK